MDENADRIPDYWLFDLRSDGTFEVIAQTTSTSDGRKKREDSSHSRQRRAITRVNTGSTEKTQSLADFSDIGMLLFADVAVYHGTILGRWIDRNQ